MSRNIQIREPGNFYQDVLHPETNSGMVLMENGRTLQEDFDAHKADNTYQTPIIVGTQIQLIKQSDTTRLFFKLDADLSGGAITISLDEGATSKPLVDIEGVAVTELDKGFVEVVENAVNFTYAPKGASLKFYEALLGESATFDHTISALTQDNDYIYCSGSSYSDDYTSKVWKLRKSDLVKVAESAGYTGRMPEDPTDIRSQEIHALTQDNDYIYCGGGAQTVLSKTVWKIRKSDMTKIAESADLDNSGIRALTQDNDYIYCGGDPLTNETFSIVWKIRKSDMAIVASSVSYGGGIRALTQDNDYIYCGGGATNKVWKIRKSDMTKIAESASYGDYIRALTQDNDYVYCGGATTRKVWKIRKSDMTKIAESADYGGGIHALTQDNDYIYCGGSTTKVWKIRKSDMVKVMESVNYGGYAINALTQDNDYIYCGGSSYSGGGYTGKAWKLDKWLTPHYKYKNTILIPVEV